MAGATARVGRGGKARARPASLKRTAAKKTPAAKKFRMPPNDPATEAALDRVLGTHPQLRPGKMFGCPGYFVGRKAVACVFGDEVCVTLPPAEIDKLVEKPGYRRFQPMGRTMSGWVMLERRHVTIPRNQPLFERAIDYALAKAEAQAQAGSK
jgi:hypothetical protein